MTFMDGLLVGLGFFTAKWLIENADDLLTRSLNKLNRHLMKKLGKDTKKRKKIIGFQ